MLASAASVFSDVVEGCAKRRFFAGFPTSCQDLRYSSSFKAASEAAFDGPVLSFRTLHGFRVHRHSQQIHQESRDSPLSPFRHRGCPCISLRLTCCHSQTCYERLVIRRCSCVQEEPMAIGTGLELRASLEDHPLRTYFKNNCMYKDEKLLIQEDSGLRQRPLKTTRANNHPPSCLIFSPA